GAGREWRGAARDGGRGRGVREEASRRADPPRAAAQVPHRADAPVDPAAVWLPARPRTAARPVGSPPGTGRGGRGGRNVRLVRPGRAHPVGARQAPPRTGPPAAAWPAVLGPGPRPRRAAP